MPLVACIVFFHIGQLSEGGRLQILAVGGRPGYDTRYDQQVGRPLLAEWVDIPDPDPLNAEANSRSVFEQGFDRGAAIFSRGDRGSPYRMCAEAPPCPLPRGW